MAAPLDIKIKFLNDVVLLSLGFPPPYQTGTRSDWIRSEMNFVFPSITDDVKNRLMLLSNIIDTKKEAKEVRDRLLEERRQQQPNVPERDPQIDELTRAIQVLRVRVDGLNIKPMPKSPSTQAKFAQYLKKNSRLNYNSTFDQLLEFRKVDWWPSTDERQFPVLNSAETLVCQPFVDRIISDLRQKKGYRITENYVRGSNSQKYCENPIDLVNDLKNDVIASPSKPTFRSRKPDIVAYLPNKSGGHAITILGEVKERSSDSEFPDAAVGHVLETAMELLAEEQLSRPFIYCFLTDGFRFQFFKCTRDSNKDFEFSHSVIFLGEIGWQIFFGLLTTDGKQLGIQVIEFDGYEIVNGLGIGRFSCAYRCRNETTNEDLVLKYFTSEYREMGAKEFTYLQEFSERGINNVPIVRTSLQTETSYMLVVAPVGLPVIPSAFNFTPKMMIDLLNVLKNVHSMNLIHRDVKPDNIYFDSNDPRRIILGDWSSAANSGVPCLYQGTPFFGGPKVDTHTPTIQLDLKCLVKTIFFISHQKNYPNIDFNNSAEITNYWNDLINNYPQFAVAMDVADTGNYDALENILKVMW